jgi:hypothetical protein
VEIRKPPGKARRKGPQASRRAMLAAWCAVGVKSKKKESGPPAYVADPALERGGAATKVRTAGVSPAARSPEKVG